MILIPELSHHFGHSYTYI